MTRQAKDTGPRVGLFGLLGSGNIGNDASTEVIVRYLRTEHPDAVVDAMCMGWKRMRDRYGIEAIPIQWQAAHKLPGGPLGAGLKVLGKWLDIFRTAAWVRRHDVVIVPGMGIMEAALPLNPWGVPWSLFLLAATGRLLRTRVALVSAGATPAKNRMTARLFTSAARQAYYRSFRDEASRDVLRRQGLDTSRDPVYTDLVYGLQFGQDVPVDPLAVGVGVMAYYGSNEDRDRADEIYASYVSSMTSFVRWLIDAGRSVRLFVGDEVDQPVVEEIVADIRQSRPGLGASRITGSQVTTLEELIDQISHVTTVVATRFHNVMCALKLGKPTISIGYSPKNDSLMLDLGLGDYVLHARSLDVERLKIQFTDIESHAARFREQLRELLPERAKQARAQLDELSRVLFAGESALPSGGAAENEQRLGWRRPVKRLDEFLIEGAFVLDTDKVADRRAGAVGIHQRRPASCHQVPGIHRAEIHAIPGQARGVRYRRVQLRAGEEQDLSGSRQRYQVHGRRVIDRGGPRLGLLAHGFGGGGPAGVVLVVVEIARGIRHRPGKARQVEAHGVGLPHGEDRQPPVDLLCRGAVPDVPVPRESERDPCREVSHGEGGPRLGHVVVGVTGFEPGLGDDRADELT